MMSAQDEPSMGSDTSPPEASTAGEDLNPAQMAASGTILEAAFVDSAYSWPPQDGQGKNAIELQASLALLQEDDDDDSTGTTESMKERMRIPVRPDIEKGKWWQCCKSQDAVVVQQIKEYETNKVQAKAARQEYRNMKKDMTKQREKLKRKKEKYNRVPEGILIYRLDTSTRTIYLMSNPHSKTDMSQLVDEMVVAKAVPSPDKSRRGMVVTGTDGTEVTLVACEQRTAISWLESMNLMLAKKNRGAFGKKVRPSCLRHLISIDI